MNPEEASNPKSPVTGSRSSEESSIVSASLLSKLTEKNSPLSQSCSVKLDRLNYSLWLTHVLPFIKGHKLECFINGTKCCPTQFITEGTETRTNPAFEDWVAADQLLFGWLLNTMTLEISAEMTTVSTSAGLWRAAKEIAGAQTKSRLLLLRSELQRTRKGSTKMADYLAKMKSLAEQLSLAGSPIPLPDLIIQALAGLDGDYNPIVVQLSNRADEISWIEMQSQLYTFESRLEQLQQFGSSHFANYAKMEAMPEPGLE